MRAHRANHPQVPVVQARITHIDQFKNILRAYLPESTGARPGSIRPTVASQRQRSIDAVTWQRRSRIPSSSSAACRAANRRLDRCSCCLRAASSSALASFICSVSVLTCSLRGAPVGSASPFCKHSRSLGSEGWRPLATSTVASATEAHRFWPNRSPPSDLMHR